MEAGSLVWPFQIHSEAPPPWRITGRQSTGVLRKREITSSRFDFPEPFGPISTLRLDRRNSGVCGPKDSRLRGVSACNKHGPVRRGDVSAAFFTTLPLRGFGLSVVECFIVLPPSDRVASRPIVPRDVRFETTHVPTSGSLVVDLHHKRAACGYEWPII